MINKIIQVSSGQLCNLSSAHCIVCSPPSQVTCPPLPCSTSSHPLSCVSDVSYLQESRSECQVPVSVLLELLSPGRSRAGVAASSCAVAGRAFLARGPCCGWEYRPGGVRSGPQGEKGAWGRAPPVLGGQGHCPCVRCLRFGSFFTFSGRTVPAAARALTKTTPESPPRCVRDHRLNYALL